MVSPPRPRRLAEAEGGQDSLGGSRRLSSPPARSAPASARGRGLGRVKQSSGLQMRSAGATQTSRPSVWRAAVWPHIWRAVRLEGLLEIILGTTPRRLGDHVYFISAGEAVFTPAMERIYGVHEPVGDSSAHTVHSRGTARSHATAGTHALNDACGVRVGHLSRAAGACAPWGAHVPSPPGHCAVPCGSQH